MQVKLPFEAYRGTEPYIFASYAHKDAALVFPLLLDLHKRGYRIWYDEGIDPGNEWTAFIEKALEGASQVLAFISENSVASQNCRQEINLAIDDGKPLLSIHLEETELKHGLRLRMSSMQAIMKYRIESDTEFFRALDRGLDHSCRSMGKAASGIAAEQVSVSGKKNILKSKPVLTALAVICVLAITGAIVLTRFSVSSEVPDVIVLSPESAIDLDKAASLPDSPKDPGEVTAPADSPKVSKKAASPPVSPKVPDGFILIPGGVYTIGSPISEKQGEYNEVQHRVLLSPFFMAKKEVTQAEWVKVMGTNPSEFKGDDLPVERASWYEAIVFCNRKSIARGLEPCYSINGSSDPDSWGAVPENYDLDWDLMECDFALNGYRLPTESEWECASRAGTKTAFWTGQNITVDQANYDGSKPYADFPAGKSIGHTVPPGSYKPNSLGLYDMNGNVWEWCYDWYGEYPETGSTAVENPAGAENSGNRIVRGGSWGTGAVRLRSACRGSTPPFTRGDDLGLRLARSK